MDLKQKVAIVTGGGSGIGRATVLMMAGEGVRVVAASHVLKELEETRRLAEGLPGEVAAFCADLTDPQKAEELVGYTVKRFGRIDILINNAGVFSQCPPDETTLEDWDRNFNINVRAQFILDRLVLPVMRQSGEGYIINMSSSIAFSPGVAESDRAPYFSSKMAVVGLSRALLQEAREHGIKVTTVYPDAVYTNMTRDITWEGVDKSEIPWLLPEDIANGILFLLKTSRRCFVADLYMKTWLERLGQKLYP